MLNKFWPGFERKWFKRWPAMLDDDSAVISPEDRDLKLGSVIAAKKKQLKEWFQNQSQSMKRGKKNGASIDFNPKSSRRLQATEVYAAKYYESKIKPKVDEKLSAMEDRPRYTIGVVKNTIKEAWDAESEEVRLEVLEEVNNARKKLLSPSESVRTPQHYATVIESIPAVIERINQTLHEQTGWIWTILGGGPDPTYPGGQVRTV
ncbi:hypothetical protein C0992_010733, partial [Termitomyces sp. T32_za158]